MATFGGPTNFGLFTNGDFRTSTNQNFTFGTANSSSQYTGNACLQLIGGSGNTGFSSNFVEVNTSQSYQMICYGRTLQTGSNGALAGGHIGFACYDSSYRFIELAMLGGVGNTTLSRDLNAGDSYAYVNSTASFNKSDSLYYFRYLLLYPPTHPEFSTPYRYTRIGRSSPDIYYSASIDKMPEGDWRLQLVTFTNTPTTFPNIGYPTPSGTPVSNGQAGGTFNYALGNPNYPLNWTRFSTAPFSGESRTSSTPFRFATKYIKFIILLNYNQSSVSPQSSFVYALDDIFFGQVLPGIDYRNSL